MNLVSINSKNKKRVGRGISAGGGKTAGRGTKGQKSRAGHNIPKRFEGGQTPLSMRLPKLPGFKSYQKKAIVISLDEISAHFKDGENINLGALIEKKLIKPGQKAKILNNGKLTTKPTLSGIAVSKNIAKLFAEKSIAPKEPQKAKQTSTKATKVKK
jgi:large subunit ribosomal protein L15